MKTIEQMKKEVQKEGYPLAEYYRDRAGKFHDKHTHETEAKIVVRSGFMNLTIYADTRPKKVVQLTTGMNYIIPRGVLHEAKMGPKGCSYIHAEK